MARLRKTLSRSGGETDFISTVFGRGYRFLRPVVRREGKLAPIVGEPVPVVRGTSLFGRDPVLTTIRGVLDDVVSGRGHACIVSGEAGIGKTRTVEELASEASNAGVPVVWSYCRERGATPPLWPFAQLVRGTLAKGRLDLQDEQVRRWLRELSQLVPELDTTSESQLAATRERAEVDPPSKHRLFDAITQLLLMAATPKPLLLVLDDIHQADAATIDLLRYLIDEIAHTPLLILATMRTPLAGANSSSANAGLSQLLAHRNCACIPLERLSEQAVTDYLAATLGERAARLAHPIFVKSEGNPFVMQELLRQVNADPTLKPEALQSSTAALELARQRLRALDDSSIEALSCAAVIGRCFELPLLHSVTQLDMGALMVSLEAARACDVLAPAPDARTAFVFHHELLRDALYERLSSTKRRAWHRRVAEVLGQRVQAGGSVPACTLAYHLHAALPDCELRVCVQACIAAADEAGNAFAYADGARYLAHAREALDLLPDGSPRLRLKLLFGQALYARASCSGDYERLVHDVLRLARAQQDGVMLARAALLLDLHTGFPPLPDAQAALDEALAALPEVELALRAALLARRATTAPYAYDAERSAEQVASAIAVIGDTQAPYARYSALNAQLYLCGGPAHRLEALARMAELQALCRQDPRFFALPPALIELHRAIVAQQDGELSAQDTALVRCEKLTSAVGSRELLWHGQRFAALALINVGEYAQGMLALEELVSRAEHEALGGARLLCAYDHAIVLQRAPADLIDSQRHALALDSADVPSVWSTKVRVLAALGERRAALAALSQVSPDKLARLPLDRDYLGTLGALTHACIELGARDYMAQLYNLLEPHEHLFAAHITFYCEGSVAQLRGLLASGLGQHAQAVRHLAAGLTRCEQAGFKNCADQARRELARLRRN
jgi:hypothetical protein